MFLNFLFQAKRIVNGNANAAPMTSTQQITSAAPAADDRAGFIDHPTKGRLQTYIAQVVYCFHFVIYCLGF